LNVLEDAVETPDGVKTGQDYGKSIGAKLPA